MPVEIVRGAPGFEMAGQVVASTTAPAASVGPSRPSVPAANNVRRAGRQSSSCGQGELLATPSQSVG